MVLGVLGGPMRRNHCWYAHLEGSRAEAEGED